MLTSSSVKAPAVNSVGRQLARSATQSMKVRHSKSAMLIPWWQVQPAVHDLRLHTRHLPGTDSHPQTCIHPQPAGPSRFPPASCSKSPSEQLFVSHLVYCTTTARLTRNPGEASGSTAASESTCSMERPSACMQTSCSSAPPTYLRPSRRASAPSPPRPAAAPSCSSPPSATSAVPPQSRTSCRTSRGS